jgi:hypothetical protein
MPNTDTIKLNLINQSYDRNNSKVLIFQRNGVPDLQELPVAWRVIENLGFDWSHPFDYPQELQVSTSDSDGNSSGLMESGPGMCWHVVNTESGNQLQYEGPSNGNVPELHVRNNLPRGAIDTQVYRDGRLLAARTGIAPGQKAVFRFNPILSFCVVSQMTEGATLNSAILSRVNAELNLSGICSADIVMTGGGSGRLAMPFRFTLRNVRTWR